MHHSLTEAKQNFLEFYRQWFPENLEAIMERKNYPVLLISPLHEQELKQTFQKQNISWKPLDWFPHVIYWPEEIQIGTPLPGFTEGWIYSLNPSSLLPVLALNPQKGDDILDTCAAPGGKTAATASFAFPSPLNILACDASLPRFKRLTTTLKLFGLEDIATLCSSVQALPHRLHQPFDKILLDAPCSSEKHVFNSKLHLKQWSPNRIKTLSHLQSLLIKTLIPLLKPGGILVYSTCALNPIENEEVISKALNDYSELIRLPLPATIPAHTPNTPGFDPMFVAILTRQN